jgi:hypothetical protein
MLFSLVKSSHEYPQTIRTTAVLNSTPQHRQLTVCGNKVDHRLASRVNGRAQPPHALVRLFIQNVRRTLLSHISATLVRAAIAAVVSPAVGTGVLGVGLTIGTRASLIETRETRCK